MGLWHEGSEIEMLTEKMIFVDTTATQFNLTESMDSEASQPSNARSGPPRARRMSVPGDFADKDLHALHLPSKNILIPSVASVR